MLWRLPFGGTDTSRAPVPSDERPDFPALQERFEDLDDTLVPAFSAHDGSALDAQQSYRRFQLVLVVGAALASFFGAVQATLGDDGRWAAIVVVVVGALTSFASSQLRREHLPARYLVERAKAEELRALYFEYLSGVGDARALEARVADIRERKPGDPNLEAGRATSGADPAATGRSFADETGEPDGGTGDGGTDER